MSFPKPDRYGLKDRVALITGGTSGIGRAIAMAFSQAGSRVYICGRDETRCAAAASQIGEESRGICIGLAADLSSVAGVRHIAEKISTASDELHILVNNAGCEGVASIDTFPEEAWDIVLDVNLKAPFFLTQALLDLLRNAARPGRPAAIINIGSVGGLRIGPKENYSYAASKAALHHITGSLAKRLGPENITVNAIAPGFFRTELTKDFSEATIAALTSALPIRRIGRDDDIAGLAGFLASADASYITGAVIPLAGGLTL